MKPAIDFAWDDKPVDVTAEVNQIWTVANRSKTGVCPRFQKTGVCPRFRG